MSTVTDVAMPNLTVDGDDHQARPLTLDDHIAAAADESYGGAPLTAKCYLGFLAYGAALPAAILTIERLVAW